MREGILKETASQVIAAIIFAVISVLITLLIDHLRVGIYIVIFITIFLTGYLGFTKKKWTWPIAGSIVIVTCLAVLNYGLPPLCTLRPFQVAAYHLSLDERIEINDNQELLAEIGDRLKFEALPLNSSDSSENWRCEWEQLGDGKLTEQSNCTIVFQPGFDEHPDMIFVVIKDSNCNYFKQEIVTVHTLNEGVE